MTFQIYDSRRQKSAPIKGQKMANSADVQRQFNEIDTDGNGSITLDELKEFLKKDPKVSDANAAAIVKYADENGDGVISYEEFAELIRK